jgi:mycothiol synthase
MKATVRGFRADDAPGVRDVMEASFEVDRFPGFTRSEIDRAILRLVPDPDGTVVAIEDDRIVGYCTPNRDDLTVHPAFRRRGHGRRLVPAALDLVRGGGRDELQLYVPQHVPGAVAFAEAMGMVYRSSLWLFALAPDQDVPAPAFPDDVVTRSWDPDRDIDLEAWVAFMHAAFEGHPTPMSFSPTVIAHVHQAPDFDPGTILIVASRDRPDTPIAFARLELRADDGEGRRVGDVGLIGVLPAWRGRGLGRELLRWGVGELRCRGAGPIELAVEAANERATNLYRAHGFVPTVEWPHWVLPVR